MCIIEFSYIFSSKNIQIPLFIDSYKEDESYCVTFQGHVQ